MKIGIDLDGVVFDSDAMFEACALLYDLEHNGKGMVHPEERYTEKQYDWSDEMFCDFINQYLLTIINSSPYMPLAREILNKLKHDGHELIAITNRTSINEKEKVETLKRFKKEKLKFDKIIFIKGSKLPACKQENIDFMIENSQHIIEDLSNNQIKCIYFQEYLVNKINNPYIFNAKNWAEVYKIIKEYKNN